MEALGAAAAVGQFISMAAKMIDLIARLEDFLKNAPARYQGWRAQLATLDDTISYIRDNTELHTNHVKRVIGDMAPKILCLIKLCERYAPTPKAEWRSRLKKALSAWGVEPQILQNLQSLEQDKTTLLLAINMSSRATTPEEKKEETSLNMDHQRQQQAREGSRAANHNSTYVAHAHPDTPPATPTDTIPKTHSRMPSDTTNVPTAGIPRDASSRPRLETLPGARSDARSETHQWASSQGGVQSSYEKIHTKGTANDIGSNPQHQVKFNDIDTKGDANRIGSQAPAAQFDALAILSLLRGGSTSTPNPTPAPNPTSTPNQTSVPNPTSDVEEEFR
ncbi:hypothetical protein Hte_010674 [Hypoxylon texense]